MIRKSLFLAFGLLWLAGCGSSASPDLVRSMDAVEESVSPYGLKKSCFSHFYPGGKPSDYVSYYFSSLGRMEWPMTPDALDYMPGMEQAAGVSVMPAGVSIVSRQVDPTLARQVVINFDDAKGVVVLEGYDDPLKPAAIRREVKLKAPAAPEQLAVMTCQSNAENGMSFSSF